MEKQQQTRINIQLKIPNVQLFKINQGNENLLQQNVLYIGKMKQNENYIYILILGNFHYSLSKDIGVMSSITQDKKALYAFPAKDGYFGIVLNQDIEDAQLQQFENILEQNCNYISYQQYEQVDQEEELKEEKQENSYEQIQLDKNIDKEEEEYLLNENEEEEKEETEIIKKTGFTDKLSNFFRKGGVLIKKGMITGAEKVSEGIKKGGKYIKSKLKKNEEETVIKQSTKNKFKIASKVTDSIYKVSSIFVKGVIKGGEKIGDVLVDKFEQSKHGQKISQSETYNDVKKVGKAGIHVVASVFDGLFGALVTLGRGISKTTTEIVEHKFGKDVAEVTEDSFDTVGNIGKYTEVITIQLAKEITKDTKEDEEEKEDQQKMIDYK